MLVEWESIRDCSGSGVSVAWGSVEPDPSTFTASRGAGGGRGGLRVALRSVEAIFDLAFVPAGVSPTP